jgi:hypothetical protein
MTHAPSALRHIMRLLPETNEQRNVRWRHFELAIVDALQIDDELADLEHRATAGAP